MSCAHCQERPAVCIGSYERQQDIEAACDICCGHGNEDGWCLQIEQLADREPLVQEVLEAVRAYDDQDATEMGGARMLAACRELARWKP